MKIRIKRPAIASKPQSATSTRSADKNPVEKVLEPNLPRLRLFPFLIEADGEKRFYVPSFDVEDFLLCCRYLYYCQSMQLITDQLYDEYEALHVKLHPESALTKPGSDKGEDYPPHIRALGLYFAYKLTQRVNKIEVGKPIPMACGTVSDPRLNKKVLIRKK